MKYYGIFLTNQNFDMIDQAHLITFNMYNWFLGQPMIFYVIYVRDFWIGKILLQSTFSEIYFVF
jgi:hypothetical protein